MLTDDEIAFLRARLDEDEAAAKVAANVAGPDWTWKTEVPEGRGEPTDYVTGMTGALLLDTMGGIESEAPFVARYDPARAFREVAVWRRLLLEYQIPPGTDAAYVGTERETGFRLALSAALRAKIATYDGNPVTGEPYPSGQTGGQPQ